MPDITMDNIKNDLIMKMLTFWNELNAFLPVAERMEGQDSAGLPLAVAVTEAEDVAAWYRPRDRFAHKG